jgi:TolA-binding protein
MINGLESIVKELSAVKDEQFHTIQSRQAEAESARAESETYANRTKELEFQLREANERIAFLEDTPRETPDRGRPNFLSTPDRYNASPSPSPSRQNSNGGSSSSEVSRLLAEAETRAEARLSDLRFKVRSLEKERNDQEEEFGQKLQERVFEIEKLKRGIQEREGQVGEADQRVELEKTRTAGEVEKRMKVEKELRGMMARLEEAKEDVATAQEGEVSISCMPLYFDGG